MLADLNRQPFFFNYQKVFKKNFDFVVNLTFL